MMAIIAISIPARAEWFGDARPMMGTEISVRLWHDDAALGERLVREVFAEAERIDKLMSTYIEDSRISEINREEGIVGTSPEKSWAKLGTPERMKELGLYIDEAVKLAGTDLEKRRVETWKKGVWEYMKAGHRQFYPRAKE